jgi:predicted aminopeptidase
LRGASLRAVVAKSSARLVVASGIIGLTVLTGLSGCASLREDVSYYWQSTRGHLSIIQAAKPIDQWLADVQLNPALKRKLSLVQEIRSYASRELGLPDNGSYRSYADLQRQFVVWNITATPELSLKMRQWCFPVVGCVTYRGYYDKDAAEGFAQRYRDAGEDVQVAGVPAYSTLGYFNDPVLNTFIQYPDAELARLIFHELSHQVVYIKNDTTFNESFATAVEVVGVERWLRDKNDAKLSQDYAAYQLRRSDFLALLLSHRERLEILYKSAASDTEKREGKAAVFKDMREQYERLKRERWNEFKGYDRYFTQQLGNAHLASVATYNDNVQGFLALADQHDRQLPQFFFAVAQLAKLDKPERDEKLKSLVETKAASKK